MASPANSIPDTQLGLTTDEIRLLRHHQAAASTAGGSSSRAASRASSQGLLLLDSASLAALARHFDRLMQQISDRIEHLSEQAAVVTTQQYDRAGHAMALADAEIARFTDINRQLDELEEDFDRIAHIKDIVKAYRQRVEEIDRRLEQSSSTAGARREHRHRHTAEASSARRRERR